MQTDIFDKETHCFQIETPDHDNPTARLNIYRKRWLGKHEKAGYVNLFWKSEHVLEISDIELEPCFRNHGLGSAVMEFIFEIAGRRGIELIEGYIVAKDARATPYLPTFYRKIGFVVEAIGPDDPLNKKSGPYSTHLEALRIKDGTSRSDDHQKVYVITKSLVEEEQR